VYITHAFGRRIAESNFVSAPLLHDLFGDPTLRGQRRASIGVAIFLILPNTQRSDKVKGRKGKRASIVVEFRSRCARRWRHPHGTVAKGESAGLFGEPEKLGVVCLLMAFFFDGGVLKKNLTNLYCL
jgi:hypothetical protein